jgi:hypothetical protein
MSPLGRVMDYKLDYSLGKWYAVWRHVQFDAYRSETGVYVRDKEGLRKGIPRPHQQGFFDLVGEIVDGPPLKSNPINPNYSGPNTVWTCKGRALVRPRVRGIEEWVICDQIPRDVELDHIDLVSDASVHVARCKSAVAFQARDAEHRRFLATLLMEAYPGTYSYCEELRGLYQAMKRTLTRFPNCKKVTCHCDCESGIKKIQLPLEAPGKLMDPEMDVVLAIKKLVSDVDQQWRLSLNIFEVTLRSGRPGRILPRWNK